MATDTTALQERIARAIYGAQEHTLFPADLDEAPKWLQESVLTDAAAVLPIVEAEVRKVKAEALREAALQYGPGQIAGMFSRDGYTRAWLNARATEYETGDQT